jgi:hypothetical protein
VAVTRYTILQFLQRMLIAIGMDRLPRLLECDSASALVLPANSIQLAVKSHDSEVTEVVFKKLSVPQVCRLFEYDDLFED